MVKKLIKPLVILILILIIVTIVIIGIKANKSNDMEDVCEFSGVVDEVTATSIIVIPDEGEDILRSSDKISVGTNGLIYEKGDRVIVTYKEGIAEIYPARVDVISVIKEEYSRDVKLYITLIDSIMNQDEGLNENIEYLSIDTDSFKQAEYKQITYKKYKDITDNDKSQIINYCSKYNSDIRECGLEELKQQDLFDNQTMSLNGMVIYVQNIYELTTNKAKIEIVKYVGGNGAVFATYTVRYVNNSWKVIDVETAIS